MVRGLVWVLAALWLPLPAAQAGDDEARQVAIEMLELTGMEAALDESIQHMLELQFQQNPELSRHEAALRSFFDRHMSFTSLKDDLAQIYADAFTAAELRELVAFYRTPVGEKTIRLMPALMQKGAQLGIARVQANSAELEALLESSPVSESEWE